MRPNRPFVISPMIIRVIFPSRVSLFAEQLLRMLHSLFIFSVKFVFKYASSEVENHIPNIYFIFCP